MPASARPSGFLRAPIAFEVVRSRYMRLSAFDPAAANAIIAEMRGEALEVVRAGAGDRAPHRAALGLHALCRPGP